MYWRNTRWLAMAAHIGVLKRSAIILILRIPLHRRWRYATQQADGQQNCADPLRAVQCISHSAKTEFSDSYSAPKMVAVRRYCSVQRVQVKIERLSASNSQKLSEPKSISEKLDTTRAAWLSTAFTAIVYAVKTDFTVKFSFVPDE